MSETLYAPRAKWWGFVKDDLRYLMRYHHTIAIFSKTAIVFTFAETKTDRAGLNDAIRLWTDARK